MAGRRASAPKCVASRLHHVAQPGSSAKGVARREEILAAAFRVIAERGYRGSTLRGIARELGLEPAHVLYYFDSREDLLREVIERWDADSADLADTDDDALGLYTAAIRRNLRIRGIVHLYLAFATEAVDADHPAHAFFAERFTRVTELLATALRRGQSAGQIRSDVDPDRSARMLIALADGLQLQALMDPTIDAPGDLELAIGELEVSPRTAQRTRQVAGESTTAQSISTN